MALNRFYHRQKIRLPNFRALRSELCTVYRACVAKTLAWEDARSAALILSRISALDEGVKLDERVAALEQALDVQSGRPGARRSRINGHEPARPRL